MFVWRISERSLDKDNLADPVQLVQNKSFERTKSLKANNRFIKSSPIINEDRELDSIAKYRKDRALHSISSSLLKKLTLAYSQEEVKEFKKETLYYATRLMRGAPKCKIQFNCSFGIDTR